MGTFALSLLLWCCAAPAATLRYWVQPCSSPQAGCRTTDPELAEWAMEAWQTASDGHLKLENTAHRKKAHISIFWTGGRDGVYGETRPILVEGVRGAEVYVLPTSGPADDADGLLRDAIVYLTCL